MAKDNLKTRMKKITAVEWIVSSAGSGLFLFTFIFVLYSALFSNGTPPNISMRLESVQHNGIDYLVTIIAENKGDESVEGLDVEVVLLNGKSEVEKGETTFDYVPGNSKRKGGIFFKNNPDEYKVELRPLGFEEP